MYYDKHVITLYTPIIIMLIQFSKPEAWGYRGWKIEGWYKKINSRAIVWQIQEHLVLLLTNTYVLTQKIYLTFYFISLS